MDTYAPVPNGLHHAQVPAQKWSVTKAELRQLKKAVKRAVREDRTIKPYPKGDDNYDEEFDCVDLHEYDPSVYQVVDWIKKQHLVPPGSSWALTQPGHREECTIFATHAWQEGIFEFINTALSSFPPNCDHMYVCFLGNPQDQESLDEIMLHGPAHSPFALALQQATWFVVVPTKRGCIYKRLWCVYEMYLAQKRVRDGGDLKVRMAWLTPKRHVAFKTAWVICLVPIPGFLLAFFGVGRYISTLFGPLMWLLISHLLGTSVWLLLHCVSHVCIGCVDPEDKPHFELKLLQTWTYVRIALVGFFGGLALFDVFVHRNVFEGGFHVPFVYGVSFAISHTRAEGTRRWERGETNSCILVFFTFTLMYMYDLVLAMIAEIIHHESGKLNSFESICDAKCSNPKDEENIWSVIADEVDEIDRAIEDLRAIGKFDRFVLANLNLGMHPDIIRDGLNPMRFVCGCCAWAFWLVTDLSARGFTPLGIAIPVGFSIAGLLVIYLPHTIEFKAISADETYIFFVNSFMWFGIMFAIVSNHPSVFKKKYVEGYSMTLSSAPIWLVFFTALLYVNLFFYCGFYVLCKRKLLGACAKFCGIEYEHAQLEDEGPVGELRVFAVDEEED